MSKNGDSKKSDKNTNEKESFVAFVLLKIEGKLDEVLKGLKQIKEVKETYLLFGEYDAIVKIEVKNVSDIETISKKILECIGPVKVVLTLHTHPLPPFVYGDIEGRLKTLVGETGIVKPKYGGYEIQVLNEPLFPWLEVFKLLLEINHEIWVSGRDGKVVITSKPPSV